jgi:hypothetical protein
MRQPPRRTQPESMKVVNYAAVIFSGVAAAKIAVGKKASKKEKAMGLAWQLAPGRQV